MTTRLQELVRETVERNDLLPRGGCVLVGVSGGQDSLALMHCLHALQAELDVVLHVGHVHHGLRLAEADADMEFVATQCEALGLPFHAVRCDARATAEERRISVEHAARSARHRALREMAETIGAQRIALGHTADDRAETVLLNLLRGTGTRGLGAMRLRSGPIVRPLLRATREMTGQYCDIVGIQPRWDSLNADVQFQRNRIRAEVLPYLRAYFNPRITEALNRLADVAAEESDYLDGIVEETLDRLSRQPSSSSLTIARDDLRALPLAMRRRLVRATVARLCGHVTDLPKDMVDAVIAYACSEVDTPASWSVPDNAIVFRVSSAVEVKLVQPLPNPYSLQLQCPSRTELPYGTGAIVADRVRVDHVPERLDLWCVVLPESAVEYPLLARTFADGDRLTPIGLGRSKKLGDCFADRKVSREDRYRTPIIADAKGILWVPGVVADERIKVCNVPCICIRLRLDRGVRTPTV